MAALAEPDAETRRQVFFALLAKWHEDTCSRYAESSNSDRTSWAIVAEHKQWIWRWLAAEALDEPADSGEPGWLGNEESSYERGLQDGHAACVRNNVLGQTAASQVGTKTERDAYVRGYWAAITEERPAPDG